MPRGEDDGRWVRRVRDRAGVTLRMAQSQVAMQALAARRTLQKGTARAVEAVKSGASLALLPFYTRLDKRYTRNKRK